jgi:DNA-binding NtrC family response regulator
MTIDQPRAVAVIPTVTARPLIVGALQSLGFAVVLATDFEGGSAALAAAPPTMLVTEARLREFHGLHLVLRARSHGPQVSAVVISNTDDPTLKKEVERMHAIFLLMPIGTDEVRSAVLAAIQSTESDSSLETNGTG